MSSNILIVEGESDKQFIERLRCELGNTDFTIDPPIVIESLDGLSEKGKSLEKKLHAIGRDIGKRNLGKIGILLDADDQGIVNRLKLINQAVKALDPKLDIVTNNTWYKSELLDVYVSCHILNINGYGELDSLLKTIISQPSPHAECLDAWKNCLNGYGKSISDKELRKLWVQIYISYDCHSKEDREQGSKKCNLKASLNQDVTDIWDFTHAALHELKSYLLTFGQ